MNRMSEPPPSLAHLLALNRTVVVVLVSVLFFGLGEQLWESFMPVWLAFRTKEMARTAAASGFVPAKALWLVGIYAWLRNLFEGCCYLGGGHLTGKLGDRGSLLLFGLLTVSGYVLFLSWQAPVVAVVAALLILGWEPLSVPVTFTTVGSTVGESRRGMAFAIQSIQKRLPKVIGPLIAGFVLGWATRAAGGDKEAGSRLGMPWLIGLSLLLGLASLAIQLRFMPHHPLPPPGPSFRTLFRRMHPTLRRLLFAEVFKRWCDWMVREFVVLYVVLIRGVTFERAGALLAIQNTTALLTYLPIGRLTQSVGLQPFIGFTFIFFALFPLALALVPDERWLVLAFVINGLREIGEPARKALITSLLPPEVRARGVGLYWGLRSFAICWASLAGAALWWVYGPTMLLFAACGFGSVGAILYFVLCRRPVPELEAK